MAQIMQPHMGQWPSRGSDWLVVHADQLAHERAHGVGIERFTPPVGEDQAAAVIPGRSGNPAFFGLLAAMLAQHGHGFAVDANGPGPAAAPQRVRPRRAAQAAARRDVRGVQVATALTARETRELTGRCVPNERGAVSHGYSTDNRRSRLTCDVLVNGGMTIQFPKLTANYYEPRALKLLIRWSQS
jgi:hypothetical protein